MTPHLWRIVQLRCLGLSTKEIAKKLNVSEKTFSLHITKIYFLLSTKDHPITNVAQLIWRATELGYSPYQFKDTANSLKI